MLKKFGSLIRTFFWAPFLMAFIGYYVMDGGSNEMSVLEAIYASAALYFVNPVLDKTNLTIIIAQLFALIVTADVLLSLISSVFGSVSKLFIKMYRDSTAVYTDTDFGESLLSTVKHGYMGTDRLYGKEEGTKDHIIMFKEDSFNLSFYEAHKASFDKKNRRVFIALNHMDSSLLRSFDDPNVHFFCLDEIAARDFWKKNNLYDELNSDEPSNPAEKIYKIAILGYGNVGKSVFRQGYLNNLYNLNQRIEYHIWGCDCLDKQTLDKLNTGNSDTIVGHEGNFRDNISEIEEMDRIIVTEGDIIDTTQVLLRRNKNYKIYCYNSEELDLSSFYATDRVFTFGNLSGLLNCDNIKTEKLFRMAKLLNYDYILRSEGKYTDTLPEDSENVIEKEWRGLNGFTKGSNVAHADYFWIEEKNSNAGMADETRWELEHIRWCRYHYINGWSFAEGPKNFAAKTHKDLVPFKMLSLESKKKDGVYNMVIRQELEELS